MHFHKIQGTYKATRVDGQIITIERAEEGSEWVSRYEDDFEGDNTAYFKTKRDAVASENHIENLIKG